jgi:hypothetical protein
MVWHARANPCLDDPRLDHGDRIVTVFFAAHRRRAPSGVKRAEKVGTTHVPNALTFSPTTIVELSTATR